MCSCAQGDVDVIDHQTFLRIVQPAFWDRISLPDTQALLKRSVILILTKTHVYVRPATESEVMVKRVPMETYDLLLEVCKPRLNAFKNGSTSEPAGYLDAVAKERDWVGTAFQAEMPGGRWICQVDISRGCDADADRQWVHAV